MQLPVLECSSAIIPPNEQPCSQNKNRHSERNDLRMVHLKLANSNPCPAGTGDTASRKTINDSGDEIVEPRFRVSSSSLRKR